MKLLGVLIAIAIFIAVIVAGYFGLSFFGDLIYSHWNQLETNSQSMVLLISTAIIICSIISVFILANTISKTAGLSQGKYITYHHFSQWYLQSKHNNFESTTDDQIQSFKHDIYLWANNHVVKQFNLLDQLVISDAKNNDAISKQADLIYLEILRDLGHRGSIKVRSV